MADPQLRALARAVDAKDVGTHEHSARVARLACALARCCGWPVIDQRRIYDAGLVHDVGKLGIDEQILRKPTALTSAEYSVIRTHPEAGVHMLAAGDFAGRQALRWIAEHHERPDGAGYPHGLSVDTISAGGALLAMADAFDVMCSARPYKEARPATWGVAEAGRLCGRQFVHLAVRALERCYEAGDLAAYDGQP